MDIGNNCIIIKGYFTYIRLDKCGYMFFVMFPYRNKKSVNFFYHTINIRGYMFFELNHLY
jgi:hypothetical protein